jgi:hypothetical protein
MRTLALTALGVVLLLAFVAIAATRKRGPGPPAFNAPRAFIFLWLGISAAHFYIGVFREGYPVGMELAVHAIIFGVPAALAWYLSRRSRPTPPPNRESRPGA